jgi:hypothetical protein
MNPIQFGIQNNKESLEYRHKFFHILFIPLLPLGSFWVLNVHGVKAILNPEKYPNIYAQEKPKSILTYIWIPRLLLAWLIFKYEITPWKIEQFFK